jgi:Flp pilus assembly protein TadD
MSIIEQTLNRLDADKPFDDTDDRPFTGGFAMKRRNKNAPRWALLALVLALAGSAAWWSTRGRVSEMAVAEVAAPALAPGAGTSAPVAVPAAEPVVSEPLAQGALPIVRPTASPAPAVLVKPEGAVTAYLDMAPRWLVVGRGMYDRGSKDDAQAVWSEGVMALPGYHMVLLFDGLPSDSTSHAAFAKLAAQYPVVQLTSKHAGRALSHVFAYTDGEVNEAMASSMARKLEAATSRWVSAATLRLQLKGTGNDKPATAGADATGVARKAAPQPVVERKPMAQAKAVVPVAALPIAMSAPVQPDAPSLLARAEKMINANQAVEALFELRAAKGQQLEDWRYHYLVGVAEMKLGRRDKAHEALSAAVKINPRQAEPRLKRAVLNQEQGLHNDAMADLREAEKIAPLLPDVYLNQGYSADALNRLREARVAYLQFLKLSESTASYGATRDWVTKRLGDLNAEVR